MKMKLQSYLIFYLHLIRIGLVHIGLVGQKCVNNSTSDIESYFFTHVNANMCNKITISNHRHMYYYSRHFDILVLSSVLSA